MKWIPSHAFYFILHNEFPNTELKIRSPSPSISICQVHIGWLHGTEPRGAEEAPGCHGLAGEEAAAVLEEAVGEEEEEEGEDLRGASSVVGEGAEVGGADMFAPSPGKLTWVMTAAFHGNIWTNQDIIYTVSMETWWDDVVTMTYRLCVDVLCFVIMSCIQRIKVIVTEVTLSFF